MNYTVTVRTGNKPSAGTNANVYITLFGPNSQTPELNIDHPNRDDFERNQTDQFNITTDDIGELQRIRVRHDNSGRKPGWYLKNIEVVRHSDGLRWTANCRTWLAKDEGDGRIDKTFNFTRGAAPTWTLAFAEARLYGPSYLQQSTFDVDPLRRSIFVEVFDGAASALITHNSWYGWFPAGTHMLFEGGTYTLTVGVYGALPGDNPRVRVWYDKRV